MAYILGISAYYHDSSATLLKDGEILASIEEEKFSRKKHDKTFPCEAIRFCLNFSGISLAEVDQIIFYDKPLTKFERLLETYVSFAPFGWSFYKASLPEWFSGKIFLEKTLKHELQMLDSTIDSSKNILFCEHHLSHAASAFFPSPFDEAVILCIDGVGEWNTTSSWIGRGSVIDKLWNIDFPHSIGLLYSAFTYYLGFEVNNGEYKMMGLSPYGKPIYADKIKEHLIDIKADGSFSLDMSYFSYTTDLVMTNKKFSQLFGREVRNRDEDILQFHMDVAASIQSVTENCVLKIATSLKKETGIENLCLAGGVALNCVANGKLKEANIFENIWVQPAAGDAGGSLGSALSCHYQFNGNSRSAKSTDNMKGSLLGPEYSNEEVENILNSKGCVYSKSENICKETAQYISEAKVVGWFQGRAEYGPRALGNRSILGDPRDSSMQKRLNLKIKYRESFRPFAPVVLEECVSNYFNFEGKSPYMLFTAKVKNSSLLERKECNLFERLAQVNSPLPAITHVDLSARLQTVSQSTNRKFHNLLSEFSSLSGFPVLINTSFNIRGEPIVLTPENAINCFMNTEMDILVLNDFILKKEDQSRESFKAYTTTELSGEVTQKVRTSVSELDLKNFTKQFSIFLMLGVGILLPYVWKYNYSLIPFILGALVILIYFIRPRMLTILYHPWTWLMNNLTFIKGQLLLVLGYFVMITPIALIMKMIGKDPMRKSFSKEKESYFLRSEESTFDPQSLKFPF
ncbi:hypothetical protein BIY24_15335 [Halobacteriovorax marinus]|nr:SxtJ family membrane protein [Halobacteriovorax marinus]ATH09265.1 hypothetical protein BIY24_15335 [Halobacteriovorax marinus]